ncbi:MAG: hypothetical protein JST73_06740 [Actinobacteria bacterium]|nr:hypothetical protein [Actinomycetota bacterium]
MVAFVGSFVAAIILMGAIVRYGRRRPAGKPLTWGEAALGATFAFFCMFWAYAIVPESWINFFQNDLKWRPDQFLAGPHGSLVKGPISFSKAALGDIITTVIYVFMVGAHMSLFMFWNRRGKLQADEARKDAVRRGGRRPSLGRKGQLA